jgi:chemosensory pili system protein ChpB (putative protein-glutamate methylesterase)
MSADLSKIHVGIITDDNEQQHIIRSALLALGFKVRVTSSPQSLGQELFSSNDIQLWIIDLIEQDIWDNFIDRIIEESPATLMFSDGNAPPTYSGKYPRWQKRLLAKISHLLDLGALEVPESVVQARIDQIQDNLKSIVSEEEDEDKFVFEDEPAETKSILAQRVWVIGASLGGPAAVKLFLDALKPDLPIAFILAQHIDEGFQALLGQVLGRNNNFELIKEFDRIQLKNGQILIAPADNAIRIDVTRHVVHTTNEWEGIYSPSINQVMRIVAEQYGARCGAIIFSGMGDDSKEAAEYMSSVGGTIWAQTAETCANSSQPDACRESGYVSYSGSPQQLAAKLMNTLETSV